MANSEKEDVCDVPGESGRGERDVRAVCERRKDVLHLSFSSGLSGTANSMRMAAEELSEEYPERKILAVDTLCACMGEGLLLHKALQLKAAGKTMEEVAQWWKKINFISVIM